MLFIHNIGFLLLTLYSKKPHPIRMNLKQYITQNGCGSAARLAKAVGMNPLYLSQITTGRRKPSAAMAGRIAKATGFQVSLESLRPDIYKIFNEQGTTEQESQDGSKDASSNFTQATACPRSTVSSASSQGTDTHGGDSPLVGG